MGTEESFSDKLAKLKDEAQDTGKSLATLDCLPSPRLMCTYDM